MKVSIQILEQTLNIFLNKVSIPNCRKLRQVVKRYPRGVMVKALDCRIVLREFLLQSRY